MLVLLSPAKTLDLESRLPAGLRTTQPRFLERTSELLDVLRPLSPADLASLMHVSDDIAELTARRYSELEPPFTRRTARPALYTFAGDVYQGLDAHSLDRRDVTEAGKTLRMLSGLYGLLRPLDLIQPYRLEMGIPLATPRGRDLYAYWRDTLTRAVVDDLAASPGPAVVVNLASAEYAAAVDLDGMDARVISPRFEDRDRHGEWKVLSFPAKRARGVMARWLVQTRARSARAITRFDGAGYAYQPSLSSPEVPLFRRERA